MIERLEKDHRASADFFAYRMLRRIDGNREISSRTVNCQLYQIKEPKNFFSLQEEGPLYSDVMGREGRPLTGKEGLSAWGPARARSERKKRKEEGKKRE